MLGARFSNWSDRENDTANPPKDKVYWNVIEISKANHSDKTGTSFSDLWP